MCLSTRQMVYNSRVKRHIKNSLAIAVIVILVLALAGLCLSFWREYQRLSHVQTTNDQRLKFSSLIHARPATVSDIAYISPWMTFDYINLVFKLPPDFLKTQLSITDPLYPRLSINHASRDMKTVPAELTNSVKSEIQIYLNDRTPQAGATSTPFYNTPGVVTH